MKDLIQAVLYMGYMLKDEVRGKVCGNKGYNKYAAQKIPQLNVQEKGNDAFYCSAGNFTNAVFS